MLQNGKSIANNNIRLLRKAMRLTQKELALLMSQSLGTIIDTTTISRHEQTPASRHPSQAELQAYASVFKVPVVALFADVYNRDQLFELLATEGDWVWDARQEEYITDGETTE